MKVIYKVKDIIAILDDFRKRGKIIGFVPTMGYLHEGHLSLIRSAKKECNITVVSIFINPIQFVKNEDFDKYPRDLTRDLKIIEDLDVDLVFNPTATEIYPEGYFTFIDIGSNITKTLCGKSRPDHFKGVATVVTKLFNIVAPNKAYFGQKDAQQCVVIKKMVKDLNMKVDIVICPTVREEDGLAMSSRNTYLSIRERKIAPGLYKTLHMAQHMIELGEKDAKKILKEMKKKISKYHLIKIDYVSIVDPETLEDIETISGEILIALAVQIGKTRLIDNIIVK
ncbi:MAG: pantoate--beta-alanine ligase [Candidatus Firestonebacteria bacterium]